VGEVSLDDAVALGSAVVPTAVFGVSPKTLCRPAMLSNGPKSNSNKTGWRDAGQSDRDGMLSAER
jgi:hypothetical protein